MKKNKMMRAASALLVAVLLTTCAVSGTFAKYTTEGSASDTARVAKWGVEVTSSGLLFSEEYGNEANGNDAADTGDTITVASVNAASVADSVVAPGTKNDTGITFTITGKPEVMVDVDLVVTNAEGTDENPVDIFLAAGTYADMTTGTSNATVGGDTTTTGANDTFTFTNAPYYPVKFTLVQTTTNGTATLVDGGTLADVENALETLSAANQTVAPNTDLESVFGTFNLTWEWAFDDTTSTAYANQADTLLGNLAADSSLQVKWVDTRFDPVVADNDYCNDASFKVAITVTQID